MQTKQASAFIVMAIMGGAILLNLMGYVTDRTDISRSFIIPMLCFAFIGAYVFAGPRLARSEGVRGIDARHMH